MKPIKLKLEKTLDTGRRWLEGRLPETHLEESREMKQCLWGLILLIQRSAQ